MQLFKFFFRQQSLNGRLILFTIRILARIDDLPHPQRISFGVKMGMLLISAALSLNQPWASIAPWFIYDSKPHRLSALVIFVCLFFLGANCP